MATHIYTVMNSKSPPRPGTLPVNAQPVARGDAPTAHDATSAQTPQEAKKATRKRKLLVGVLVVVVLAILLVFGIPWVEEMLNTVSTDDAFVNGPRNVCCAPCGKTDFPRSGG